MEQVFIVKGTMNITHQSEDSDLQSDKNDQIDDNHLSELPIGIAIGIAIGCT